MHVVFPEGAMPMPRPGVLLAGGVAISGFALAESWLLSAHPLRMSTALVAGIGLVAIMVLALTRFDMAVALGVLLLAAVRVEPAPADAVFAVVAAVALATRRFDSRRIPALAALLLGAFLVTNMFSAVEVISVSRAVRFFAITLYLAGLSLWLTSYLQSAERARLVARAYLVAALLSALVGSVALFVAFPGHETFVYLGARAQGLFKDPLVYGPFLVPPALILLEELVRPQLFRMRRLTVVVCICVLSAGVLFSFSRAAWLNLAVGVVVLLAVLAVRPGGGRRVLVVLLAVVLTSAVVASALAATGSVRFLEQRAHFQGYDVERFSAQAFGIREGEKYPFGIGPGQFEVLSPVSAHSLYVRAYAESGLPGLVTLCALLLTTLLLGIRQALRGRSTYGIGSAALLGAWCGLLANSLFVDTLHWRHLWLLAALIWAGAIGPRVRYAPSKTGSRSPT
jgi:O-antigen ligase